MAHIQGGMHYHLLLPLAFIPKYMVIFVQVNKVTFLRSLVFHNQRLLFSLLFLCVASTLKDFGLDPKKLGAEIGMTMVLRTHNLKRSHVAGGLIFIPIYMLSFQVVVLINSDINGKRKKGNFYSTISLWLKFFVLDF